jgi:hypothetical protein
MSRDRDDIEGESEVGEVDSVAVGESDAALRDRLVARTPHRYRAARDQIPNPTDVIGVVMGHENPDEREAVGRESRKDGCGVARVDRDHLAASLAESVDQPEVVVLKRRNPCHLEGRYGVDGDGRWHPEFRSPGNVERVPRRFTSRTGLAGILMAPSGPIEEAVFNL